MDFVKELWKRLFSSTPIFFRKLQGILLAVSATAGAGLAQIEHLPNWAWLENTLRIGVFLGLFGTFLAQLAVTKPDELK
ncbi:MAG: hypothetical protein SFU27_06520 [Thermonemataceae bacterium]|nr:hypothetical protein [Thermonemataceae bacterium]